MRTHASLPLGMAAAAALSLVLAAPLTAKRVTIPAGNLVQNPGFEASAGSNFDTITPPAGWSTSGAATVWVYASAGDRPTSAVAQQIGGGVNFLAGGINAPVSTAAQSIDVSGAAPEIDGTPGVQATLSAALGSYSSSADNARVDANYLDAAGASLGTLRVGPVTSADRGGQTTLLPRAAKGILPKGTRHIDLVVVMTMADTPKNQGFADNVSLELAVAPPPPAPATPKPTLALTCKKRVITATVKQVPGVKSVTFGVNGQPFAIDRRAPFALRLSTRGLPPRVTVTASFALAGRATRLATAIKRC